MYLFILQYNGKEINRDFEKGLNRSEIYRSHSIMQKDFPCGKSFCMELMTRFELVTSSLPRMRSTY